MSALAYDRDMILDTAEFLDLHPSRLAFESLQWWTRHLPHDDMVEIVNGVGVVGSVAALIVRAWSASHGLSRVVVEFATAVCGGAHTGEIFAYRVSKKTWGDLVAVREDSVQRSPIVDGDGVLRLWFSLNENNPLRLKQQTRNELKAVLGRDHRGLVDESLRSSKGVFLDRLTPCQSDIIFRLTQLAPGDFWRVVKNGDADVASRLGRIPSADRERMRKRGMYVSASPQMSLSL